MSVWGGGIFTIQAFCSSLSSLHQSVTLDLDWSNCYRGVLKGIPIHPPFINWTLFKGTFSLSSWRRLASVAALQSLTAGPLGSLCVSFPVKQDNCVMSNCNELGDLRPHVYLLLHFQVKWTHCANLVPAAHLWIFWTLSSISLVRLLQATLSLYSGSPSSDFKVSNACLSLPHAALWSFISSFIYNHPVDCLGTISFTRPAD